MQDNGGTRSGEPAMFYLACWTEDDGIYWCGHEHRTVADALRCLVLDGRGFLRACESGMFRSLNDREFVDFLAAIGNRSRRSSAEKRYEGRGDRVALFPALFLGYVLSAHGLRRAFPLFSKAYG